MTKIVCLMLIATSAQAGVYRCDERGEIRYQNQSCPGGTFQQELRIATPPPPELFMLPPVREIRARVPVRVVPVIGDGSSVESASSDPHRP